MLTYFGVELVDLLDSQLQVSRVYRISDVNSLLYALRITSKSNARLHSELLCSCRIALVDQVVHDDKVNVTIEMSKFLLTMMNEKPRHDSMCKVARYQKHK